MPLSVKKEFVIEIDSNTTRDDVVEECNKHGAVMHIYVDKASPQGNKHIF